MKRLLFILMAVCVGVVSYSLLHRRAEASGLVIAEDAAKLESATNELAATQEAIALLHTEIHDKRDRLRQANPRSDISPELLDLLERSDVEGHDRARAQLREQLGIGWDSSPDYVLVSKRAIKEAWYNKLYMDGASVTPDAVNLLSLSPDEEFAMKAALARAREGQWSRIETTPPSGNIVAQITIRPPDPAFDAAQSNAFTADITSIIGGERAGLFLNDAWREFRSDVAPSKDKTLTIRQTTTDGQPDLAWEIKDGERTETGLVRYATYPYFPVMKLFPGGWQGMAKATNFELPPPFFPPNFQPAGTSN